MISRYRAVVFDMDGTLLDSMGYWRRINVDFLAARGLEPPDEIRADIFSLSNRVCARMYADRFDLKMTAEEILNEYRAHMKKYYMECVQPKKGALGYLKRLRERGVKVCVATASPMALAVPALDRHGMLGFMEFVVSAFDEGMRKEEPFFYRMAADRLGLDPAECIMFEDALYAMEGARAAGMTVYGIADDTQKKQEAQARQLCEVFVEDFDELS